MSYFSFDGTVTVHSRIVYGVYIYSRTDPPFHFIDGHKKLRLQTIALDIVTYIYKPIIISPCARSAKFCRRFRVHFLYH